LGKDKCRVLNVEWWTEIVINYLAFGHFKF
jgi:hypothetical protein